MIEICSWSSKSQFPRETEPQNHETKKYLRGGSATDDRQPHAARTSRPWPRGLGAQMCTAILPKLWDDSLPGPRAHATRAPSRGSQGNRAPSGSLQTHTHSSCPASDLPKIGKTRSRPPPLKHLLCVPRSWRPGPRRSGGGSPCSGTVYVTVKQQTPQQRNAGIPQSVEAAGDKSSVGPARLVHQTERTEHRPVWERRAGCGGLPTGSPWPCRQHPSRPPLRPPLVFLLRALPS